MPWQKMPSLSPSASPVFPSSRVPCSEKPALTWPLITPYAVLLPAIPEPCRQVMLTPAPIPVGPKTILVPAWAT